MTELPGYIQKFVRSSVYRFGDSTSFKIYIDENRKTLMPGRHDPYEYLNKIGVGQITGSAAVICPGNGGLLSELIYRGAKEVYGFEPRTVFTKALEGVLSIIGKTSEYTVTTQNKWPQIGECEGKFDLILWPEGLDISVTPHSIFTNILKMLSPQGVLFIELCQGQNNDPNPKKINKWMPTGQAFRGFIKGIDPNVVIGDAGKGRLDRRVVYKISHDDIVVIIEEPEAAQETATAKKKTAKKKKSSKKTNPKSQDKKSALAKIIKLKRDKQKQEVVTKD